MKHNSPSLTVIPSLTGNPVIMNSFFTGFPVKLGMTSAGDGGQNGYVALLSILITGAVATAIALTLLLTGTDATRSSLVIQQSIQARKLADACGEEALQQVHDNTTFTGTNALTLSTGTCSYTVTSTGASTRTIDASSTINNVVRKIKVYVTIGSSSISITSWQDVS